MAISDLFKYHLAIKENLLSPQLMRLLELQKKYNIITGAYDNPNHYAAITNQSALDNYALIFKLIRPISKSYTPKWFQALRNLSFHEYDFTKFLIQDEDKSSESIVIDETKRIQRIITDIYRDNSVLFKIHSHEFEEVVAELLNFQGFEIELTKQTRDNGFDILAIKYLDNHHQLKFLVECKKYTDKKVGVEIIRSFKEVIATEKANRGIIVTTSYFSSEALKKQAEIPYLLDFKDKDKLMEWVTNYKKQKARL